VLHPKHLVVYGLAGMFSTMIVHANPMISFLFYHIFVFTVSSYRKKNLYLTR